MKGLYGHELNCRIINESAPEISKIPFIKRGYFSADEYLGNKALLFVKRIFRRIFVKKDLPNFPLGIWMKDFVEEILPDYEDTCISEVYDIGKLRRELEITSEFRTNESFWQKYTMPAALLLAFKEYIVSERENKICRNQ